MIFTTLKLEILLYVVSLVTFSQNILKILSPQIRLCTESMLFNIWVFYPSRLDAETIIVREHVIDYPDDVQKCAAEVLVRKVPDNQEVL